MATWEGNKVSASEVVQSVDCRMGMPGSSSLNNLAHRSSHIGGRHSSGVRLVADDELCGGCRALQDGEEGRFLRIFSEQKIFSRRHYAHDLDRLAGPVFEIAADHLVRVKKAAGELLIHNRHRRRVRLIGKAEFTSREQWGLRGVEISWRDVEEKSIERFVRVFEVGGLLREDRNVGGVRQRRGVCIGGGFHSRQLRPLCPAAAAERVPQRLLNNLLRLHRISSA